MVNTIRICGYANLWVLVVLMQIINLYPNLKNVEDFTNKYSPAAAAVQEKTGFPAVATLAQIAQETGWGKHILRVDIGGMEVDSKNLFNIKANASWKGRKGRTKVWEIVDGHKIWVDDWFRVYDTYEESFLDYIDFLRKNGRYEAALKETDPFKYIEAIAKAGYATDPNYAKSISSIIKTWKVTT